MKSVTTTLSAFRLTAILPFYHHLFPLPPRPSSSCNFPSTFPATPFVRLPPLYSSASTPFPSSNSHLSRQKQAQPCILPQQRSRTAEAAAGCAWAVSRTNTRRGCRVNEAHAQHDQRGNASGAARHACARAQVCLRTCLSTLAGHTLVLLAGLTYISKHTVHLLIPLPHVCLLADHIRLVLYICTCQPHQATSMWPTR